MADPSAADSLSILLVSARRTSRDEVAQILDGKRDDTRLFWVSQPDLAAVRAQDLAARIILVDDDLGGASQAALIQELSSRIPDAAVLALVDADAMGLAREALLAGARAFVTRPLKSDEIASAFRQVIARPSSLDAQSETSQLGRLVVFCGPKGGTGRTTAAINTAISLRQVVDLPLALVDADYAAPAVDVQLNLHERLSVVDLLPHIAQLDRHLIESVLVEHPTGLRVLLAPPPADISVHISLPQLEQILLWLKRMFPWVVVDLGLPIDELALGFLDAADLVIMSANPEMTGLRNAQLMTAQFRSRGYPEDKVWLLLNRADLSGGLREKDVREYLGLKVRYRIPNSQIAATDNVNRGVPFVLASPRSPVSRAYQGLARELVRCLPLRTWSTAMPEFVASAEAATAAELATSARAPARSTSLRADEREPEVLFEAASAQPEAQILVPSAHALELSVEPATAGAANPVIGDDGLGGAVQAGGLATGVGIAGGQEAGATVGRVAVPAKRDAARQVAASKRSTRLPAVREWAGLVLAVLAIFASLGVLEFAVSPIVANRRQVVQVARLSSLSPTPRPTEAVATLTPISTRQPAGIVAASPTPSATAASPSAPATLSAAGVSASAAAAATAAASPEATATVTATPAPSHTPTEAPTATATLTSTPEPSPTVAVPTATRTRRPAASPTVAPSPSATARPIVTAPRLLAPALGAAQGGATLFQWEVTAPLPAGTGYEVVWWNNGENPLNALGIAPPVMTASLAANLDVLYQAGQLKSNDIFWTVLVVSTDPYKRLTQPDARAARMLVYQASGQPAP